MYTNLNLNVENCYLINNKQKEVQKRGKDEKRRKRREPPRISSEPQVCVFNAKICDKCDDEDARKNKKILGMTIITDMKKGDDGVWEDGEILDPKKGKVYDCKLWVENGKLQVRGYVLFFHRTQEWLKYEGEI